MRKGYSACKAGREAPRLRQGYGRASRTKFLIFLYIKRRDYILVAPSIYSLHDGNCGNGLIAIEIYRYSFCSSSEYFKSPLFVFRYDDDFIALTQRCRYLRVTGRLPPVQG